MVGLPQTSLWRSVSPLRNFIRNPSFDLWQAGTSFSATTYSADLWKQVTTAARTFSRQAGFLGARYCARIARDSGNAVTTRLDFGQALTPELSTQLAGKQVVMSADVRVGANFSGPTVVAQFVTGTGVDEVFSVSGASFPTGSANTGNLNASIVPTTTAQRLSWGPVTLAAGATEVGIRVSFAPTGTAGAADYFEITNVKLEISARQTGFEPEPIATTLIAAKRYFERIGSDLTASPIARGYADSTTHGFFDLVYEVEKYVIPTITVNGTVANDFELRRTGSAAVATTALAATAARIGTKRCQLDATVAAGLTAGEGLGLTTKTTSGFIDIDARAF